MAAIGLLAILPMKLMPLPKTKKPRVYSPWAYETVTPDRYSLTPYSWAPASARFRKLRSFFSVSGIRFCLESIPQLLDCIVIAFCSFILTGNNNFHIWWQAQFKSVTVGI